MATQMQTTPVSEQKLSRYRSVRNAVSKSIPSPAIPPEVPQYPTEALVRSRSRYRGARPNLSMGKPPSSCTSDVPLKQRRPTSGLHAEPDALREVDRVQRAGEHSHVRSRQPGSTSANYQEKEIEPDSVAQTLPKISSGRHAASDEHLDLEKVPIKHVTEHKRDGIAPHDRSENLSKAKINKNGEARHGHNTEKVLDQRNSVEQVQNGIPAGSRQPTSNRDAPFSKTLNTDDGAQTELNQGLLRKTIQLSSAINRHIKGEEKADIRGPSTNAPGTADKGQSSRGMTTVSDNQNGVPNFDAPISAVNTGQRNVTLKFNGSMISLPITPTTTTLDVLDQVASVFSEVVTPKTSVMLESYKQLGLERPLRKYERIRDVLNSWDNDSQNVLLIEASPTEGNDDDLDASSVIKGQPPETSVLIYHSQKPGKWDKRWATLRSDGQILISKSNGVENVNICHMSDYDIYIPISRQLKKIKPPKKFCFAVKSQQKSSMFLSTANFVHFFSTKDKDTARAWYKAIQERRSWYLVHVMGEGQKRSQPNQRNPQERTRNSMPQGAKFQSKSSADSYAHRNGAFKPSFHPIVVGRSKPTAFPTGVPQTGCTAKLESSPSADEPQVNGGLAMIPFPQKLTKIPPGGGFATGNSKPTLIRDIVPNIPVREMFDADGLLGNTYEQRQKAQHNRGEVSDEASGPTRSHTMRESPFHKATSPTHAPTSRSPEQLVSKHHMLEHTDNLKRTSTKRQAPKPLIDLTPKYQEPPQHSRKGKGIIPDVLPPGGLIDIATTPEMAIMIPASTTFRRPNQQDVPTIQRTKTMRGTTTKSFHLLEQTTHVNQMEANEVLAGKGQGESSRG